MKQIILLTLTLLVSLIGYSQSELKLSVRRIQKEVIGIDDQKKLVDLITEVKEDSIYGKVATQYSIYTKEDGINKIWIDCSQPGLQNLVKEEIYFKNNQVIYYRGYDYATGNLIEVFFKDYSYLIIKVNDKYVEPGLEVSLLLQNHIITIIDYLKL